MSKYQRLVDCLGSDFVTAGAQSDPSFLKDWTASEQIVPLAVIRPHMTEQVSSILTFCNIEQIAVVPQGGRTGLVGGAQPIADGVVVSLDRLRSPLEIDPVSRTATVGAGVTLAELQAAAAAHGLTFPVELGARGSCQIGGMISTNAGGIRAFRFGMTRQHVLGLEVVLPQGTVVTAMNRHLKNNTGYDVCHYFIGAEGTLGIITRAVLRLVELEPVRAVALLLVQDVAAAREVFRAFERDKGLAAIEGMWPDYWAFAKQVTGLDPLQMSPINDQIVLLVETRGWEETTLSNALLASLEALAEQGTVLDGVIAQSESQADDFWALREANAELFRYYPDLHGFDISIGVSEMEPLLKTVKRGLGPKYETLWFGHVGDGNLHLSVSSVEPDLGKEIEIAVYDAIRELGGSVSAEHGIGSEKLKWLQYSRNDSEIRLMRSIRELIDPNGIMNPGRTILMEY
ncbi:FAD-binding oxidoreductase (plasmid) [Agrobacterium leguminum]|uniref:FAD-binding oxidoreductase n=1 Tax=Agrobacterium leguminum TaxID=2792015 RepID=UPI00272C3FFE|nr:FAD-binding oxidoreductase [Agrobacterium leguminum]WLE00806.1 FAD-binding oxidoreductase [Agrobacterium leguminum]